MFNLTKTIFLFTVFTVMVPITAIAQTFELPGARAGEHYRVQIDRVLRDTYRLKLETENQNSVIRWALENGDLPPGLSVREDGVILGMPTASHDSAFAFRLRASDPGSRNDVLVLEFTLHLKAGGLRLVKFDGPTLRPVDDSPRSAGTNDNERTNRGANSRTVEAAPEPALPQDGGPVLAWTDPPSLANGDTIPHHTQSQVDLALSVKRTSRICLLHIQTIDKNGVAASGQQRVDNNKSSEKIKVNLAKGNNMITVIPFANKSATDDCPDGDELAKLNGLPAEKLTLNVVCDGLGCGKAAAVAGGGEEGGNGNASRNPFSSRNRRFIVGFEQSGAASAESQANPFLDLFLTTPLPFRGQPNANHPFARLSLWGNVKLNSSPQQIAALADVSSNAVSSITEGKINKLTTSFDFVVGPELRVMKMGRTHFSLIAGFGAITPLSPKQSTQIFKTPDVSSSQGSRFYEKYPGALGKEYIGFTKPERDRFLRQYFGGFRFRTYQLNHEGQPLDRFPGMFDVTFGQSEAVTGGTFSKFVIGLDGFYSLPFPDDKRFLFLFGSARFKAGGPKTKDTPFILDTAASSVSPTDLNVFLADPTPSNRDSYRIGFGVDLIELFKFASKKTEDKK
jgi:hypothetical protein